MRSILFTTIALAGLTTVAMAKDAVAQLPAAFTYNWSGAYIGAQFGGGWGDSHVTYPAKSFLSTDPDPSGFVGGIYTGYNFQLQNHVILGVEGDLSYFDGRGDDHLHYSGGLSGPSETWKGKIDWIAALRGRLGYAFDRTLVYGTGGIAFTNLAIERSGRGEVSDSRTGWTLGAGVEHAFSDHLITRIEYSYADFGTKSYPLLAIPKTAGFEAPFKISTVRIGVSYKF